MIDVQKVVFHPDFDTKLPFGVDVALLFLEEPTALDVPLLRLNDDPAWPSAWDIATTVGWGDTRDGGDQSDALREVDLDVMDNEECADAGHYGDWREDIYETMLCTADGAGHCQGDSGEFGCDVKSLQCTILWN